jgi:cytochrome c oxidase cbb3-type subunit 3
MPETDQLTDHDYDGIQEYDNDLPRWWLALLWISVLWAGGYTTWYMLIGMPSGPEALREELAAITEARARSSTGPLPEELMRELSHNPERIARGKALYAKAACATCHGPEATGLVGPNLRDAWWIHGSDMTAIVTTLTDGRANNAMPPQKANLSAEEILDLACFVADRGRTAAPGKAHDPAREHEQPIAW